MSENASNDGVMNKIINEPPSDEMEFEESENAFDEKNEGVHEVIHDLSRDQIVELYEMHIVEIHHDGYFNNVYTAAGIILDAVTDGRVNLGILFDELSVSDYETVDEALDAYGFD